MKWHILLHVHVLYKKSCTVESKPNKNFFNFLPEQCHLFKSQRKPTLDIIPVINSRTVIIQFV